MMVCRCLILHNLLEVKPNLFFLWLDRDKDDDEGIPSETEDDKRQLETKAKEMRGERNTFRVFV